MTVPVKGLDTISGLSVPTPDTNVVVADSEGVGLTAEEFVELRDDAGVLDGTFGQCHIHFTTNPSVSRAGAEHTADFVAGAVESR